MGGKVPQFIQYHLADGRVIVIESSAPEEMAGSAGRPTEGFQVGEASDRGQRVGRGGPAPLGDGGVGRSIAGLADGGRFTDALKTVRPAIEEALAVFQEIQGPNEIQIEFGLKFAASAGVILATGSGEATLKIAVKWQKTKASTPAPAAAEIKPPAP